VACGGDEEDGGVGDGFSACGKGEKSDFLHFFVDIDLKIWDDWVNLGEWRFLNSNMNKHDEFFKSIKPLSDEIGKIRNEYHLNGQERFNIFTAISDQYKKENLHSDILKLLLEKNENEYLNDFYTLVKDRNKNEKDIKDIIDIEFDDSFHVLREEGRIDISVYNNSYGIIIENKINNARDRDDQLARYYKELSAEIEKIAVVIYIPPIGFTHKPPLDEYEDQETAKKIKEVLVVLPVIDKNEIDIVHGFLDIIAEKEHDEIMRVFIKQYSDFLKNWGGDIMTSKKDKELLRKLLETKDSVQRTQNIIKAYNNRVIGEIIGEKLCDIGLKQHEKDKDVYEKEIPTTDGTWVNFRITDRDRKDKPCYIGIWWDAKYKKIWEKRAEEILKNEKFDCKFKEKYDNCDAWKEIDFLKVEDKTIEYYIDFVVKDIKRIEEKCKEIAAKSH
jgi:hypothetical protein